jgi:hypothetical protein
MKAVSPKKITNKHLQLLVISYTHPLVYLFIVQLAIARHYF